MYSGISTGSIHVHLPDGIMSFNEMPNGLYCHDINNSDNITSDAVTNYPNSSFLNIVEARKAKYTLREVGGADTTVTFNKEISYLCPQQYIHLLETNYLRNYPVTSKDAKSAYDIYGYAIDYLQCKTIQRTLPPVLKLAHILSLQTIKDHNREIALCADFFFVQDIPFLHTISRKLTFRTVSEDKNHKNHTMIKGLQYTISM